MRKLLAASFAVVGFFTIYFFEIFNGLHLKPTHGLPPNAFGAIIGIVIGVLCCSFALLAAGESKPSPLKLLCAKCGRSFPITVNKLPIEVACPESGCGASILLVDEGESIGVYAQF